MIEITKTQPGGYYGIQFFDPTKGSWSCEVKMSSNCNLAVVENIVQIFQLQNDEERKEVMSHLKKLCATRNILLTLIKKEHFDWFKTNYPYYYANIIPRKGYATSSSDPHQHYILLRNADPNDNREPIIEKIVEKVKYIPKQDILNVIRRIFDATQNRAERLTLIEKELNNIKTD